ncbi:MAG TPA: radical SAM protein [Candidatus Polarisedimenticolia bacterium]|jgi:7-carboxy-7-deazaguanine synthase|nr:radical SAM protein [Candidatus Polarisedimenticolia bacterium]
MTREAETLQITEIFHSIQGESTQTGRPCSFVRLTGCNLRCVWCDTSYAFEGGEAMTVQAILERLAAHGTRLILVTGGEPLAQPSVHALMGSLLEQGKEVMLETGGSLDIGGVDRRVRIVMDLKCPASGMVARNLWENLPRLKPSDEVKFVIQDRPDYEWARRLVRERRLAEAHEVLFSPVFGVLPLRSLAEWILEDRLEVRLQTQLHKTIWLPGTRGV